MVKGVSRQVIVVKSPDQQLFEQAIFILRDGAEGVTDAQLLQEAKRAAAECRRNALSFGPLWACAGAVCTGLVWLLTAGL